MAPEPFSSNAEMQDKGYADLRKLKSTVQKLLPPSSMLRNLILGEPDFIPRSEALVKIPMFAKMLDAELTSAQ